MEAWRDPRRQLLAFAGLVLLLAGVWALLREPGPSTPAGPTYEIVQVSPMPTDLTAVPPGCITPSNGADGARFACAYERTIP